MEKIIGREAELEKLADYFDSLFKNAEAYMEIVRLLSTHRDGFTRSEIANELKIKDNGHLCDMLDDLEYTLSEKEYRNIERRMETFRKETGHKNDL